MEVAGDVQDAPAGVFAEVVDHALGHGVVPAGLGGEAAGIAIRIPMVHGGHELLAIGIIAEGEFAGELAAAAGGQPVEPGRALLADTAHQRLGGIGGDHRQLMALGKFHQGAVVARVVGPGMAVPDQRRLADAPGEVGVQHRLIGAAELLHGEH